jgi:hypothetical protein
VDWPHQSDTRPEARRSCTSVVSPYILTIHERGIRHLHHRFRDCCWVYAGPWLRRRRCSMPRSGNGARTCRRAPASPGYRRSAALAPCSCAAVRGNQQPSANPPGASDQPRPPTSNSRRTSSRCWPTRRGSRPPHGLPGATAVLIAMTGVLTCWPGDPVFMPGVGSLFGSLGWSDRAGWCLPRAVPPTGKGKRRSGPTENDCGRTDCSFLSEDLTVASPSHASAPLGVRDREARVSN